MRIRVEQRRARLALRHHLTPSARAAGPVQVARDQVGLHGTDPSSVFLAACARTRDPDPGTIERALYVERTLVRMLGMRRTMFVVPVELAPVVQAACTREIAARERRRSVQLLEEAGIAGADAGRWLRDVEQATLRALEARGEATAAELAEDEPRLRVSILMSEGKAYEARQNVTTRVLSLLAADGKIVRARPRGSWTSSQYRWSPTDRWLPGGFPELPAPAARAELVRRWLAAYGPGTVADLRWWTGWTAGHARAALAEVGPVEVDLDGAAGLVLAGDTDSVPPAQPWAALLPALDPTVMGWSGREWFLGEHARALFDRSGNAGPTVWWDGRVVGGWAQRKDGEIAFRLLEDVGADAVAAIEDAAARLRDYIGHVRVTPRFPTPLQRDLAG